jgi:hypothetical protein
MWVNGRKARTKDIFIGQNPREKRDCLSRQSRCRGKKFGELHGQEKSVGHFVVPYNLLPLNPKSLDKVLDCCLLLFLILEHLIQF